MGTLVPFYLLVKTMLAGEGGATTIEYALMVAFVAMVALAAVVNFGTNLNLEFGIIAGLIP